MPAILFRIYFLTESRSGRCVCQGFRKTKIIPTDTENLKLSALLLLRFYCYLPESEWPGMFLIKWIRLRCLEQLHFGWRELQLPLKKCFFMPQEWLPGELEAAFCSQMRGITARMQYLLWRHSSESEERNGDFH